MSSLAPRSFLTREAADAWVRKLAGRSHLLTRWLAKPDASELREYTERCNKARVDQFTEQYACHRKK